MWARKENGMIKFKRVLINLTRELSSRFCGASAEGRSRERKKYVKDRGWYINQNTVTEDDVRAYQVRADRFAALDDEVIKAKKAELSSSTNMQLMGALAPFNCPNIGRMKKAKLIDALAFFLLTNQ